MANFHELEDDQKLYAISPYLGEGQLDEFVDEGALVENYDESDIANLLSQYDYGDETVRDALANDDVVTAVELDRWGNVDDYEIGGIHYYLVFTSRTGVYRLWTLLEE